MITQKDMQEKLDAIGNFPVALEHLFQWSEGAGYLNIKALEQNPRFSFKHPDYDLTFKAQVNIVRSQYAASQFQLTSPSGQAGGRRHGGCPLCFDNVASEAKPLLRAWEITLNNKPFFIQFSPFPLAAKHLVIIQKTHSPMRMDQNSVADLIQLVDLAPQYTALSNSDITGAGASVIEHHHYQAIENFDLPIMQAKALDGRTHTHGSVTLERLDFPMASIKLHSNCKHSLIKTAGNVIKNWKNKNKKTNTWNFALKKEGNDYQLWLIARSCDHRTDEQFHYIKREGLGIVEVAGEAIYPTPTGEQAQQAWKQIREHGLETFLSILQCNNPLPAIQQL